MKFRTRAIHVGEKPNLEKGGSGDVSMPIHLSTTFARSQVDQLPSGDYEYARSNNPTRNAVEQRFATLENASFGLAFSSGLAAETAVFQALVKSNDHVVAFDDLYGGSRRLFDKIFQASFNIQVTYVDAREISAIEQAFQKNTTLIWLETPTNPLLKLCDIQAICTLAKSKNITVAVDNTFMSPYFQQPLALGADLVLHSSSKYLNGHADSIGGSVMTNNKAIYKKLKFVQNAAGAILSPFDSYLVLRGTKTLALRMQQHEKNAIKIAHYLEQHPKVKRVFYPGLESHPQYDLAKKQATGFGGMISFEINGNLQQAKTFVESTQLFLLAESLGGVESLIELPALMTHASIAAEERKKIGIADGLIRLSVGIEDVDDLLHDLEQAFKLI